MMYSRGTVEFGRCFNNGFGYMSSHLQNGQGFILMAIGLLVAALIVLAVVILIRKSKRLNSVYQNNNSMELLNIRYAKGEITEEDYIRIKKVFTGK